MRAADGIGVLARIADTFARHGVRVDQAYVSTLGHEVVDSFYVTRADGAKLTDPDDHLGDPPRAGADARSDRFRSE